MSAAPWWRRTRLDLTKKLEHMANAKGVEPLLLLPALIAYDLCTLLAERLSFTDIILVLFCCCVC